MDNIIKLKKKVLEGYSITKEEALMLYDAPLEELYKAANEIRMHFCGSTFDLCTATGVPMVNAVITAMPNALNMQKRHLNGMPMKPAP